MPNAIDAIFIPSLAPIWTAPTPAAQGVESFEALFDETGKDIDSGAAAVPETVVFETEGLDLGEDAEFEQSDGAAPAPALLLPLPLTDATPLSLPVPPSIRSSDPTVSEPAPAGLTKGNQLALQRVTTPPTNEEPFMLADSSAAPAETVAGKGDGGKEYIPDDRPEIYASDGRIAMRPVAGSYVPASEETKTAVEISLSAMPGDAPALVAHPILPASPQIAAHPVAMAQAWATPLNTQQRDESGIQKLEGVKKPQSRSGDEGADPRDSPQLEPDFNHGRTAATNPVVLAERADHRVDAVKPQVATSDETTLPTPLEGVDGTGSVAIRMNEPAPSASPHLATGPTTSGHVTAPREILHQITRQMTKLDEGQIEIILTPEELGKVRMVVTPGDTPAITIYADRSDTLDLLRRNTEVLGRELRDTGFAGASLSFGEGRDRSDRHRWVSEAAGGQSRTVTPDPSAEETPPRPQRSWSTRQIDMRI